MDVILDCLDGKIVILSWCLLFLDVQTLSSDDPSVSHRQIPPPTVAWALSIEGCSSSAAIDPTGKGT